MSDKTNFAQLDDGSDSLFSKPGAQFTKQLTQILKILFNFKRSNILSRLPICAIHLIQVSIQLLE